MDFIYNSNIDAICSNYLEAHYSRSINFFYITFMIASFMKMDLNEVTMSKFDGSQAWIQRFKEVSQTD